LDALVRWATLLLLVRRIVYHAADAPLAAVIQKRLDKALGKLDTQDRSAGASTAARVRRSLTDGMGQAPRSVMTITLARDLGCTDEEIVHIRRGALLHDMGKMGIPDEILQKPGPLTTEEWEIMRKHPVYAYEMLSQIEAQRGQVHLITGHNERDFLFDQALAIVGRDLRPHIDDGGIPFLLDLFHVLSYSRW
jgi:hypothetical protein